MGWKVRAIKLEKSGKLETMLFNENGQYVNDTLDLVRKAMTEGATVIQIQELSDG